MAEFRLSQQCIVQCEAKGGKGEYEKFFLSCFFVHHKTYFRPEASIGIESLTRSKKKRINGRRFLISPLKTVKYDLM